LPGLERQLRVLSDWIVELFFPRDIVQTLPLNDDQRKQQRMVQSADGAMRTAHNTEQR
jgi:hypothetical protein